MSLKLCRRQWHSRSAPHYGLISIAFFIDEAKPGRHLCFWEKTTLIQEA